MTSSAHLKYLKTMKRFVLICWDGIFKMLGKSPLGISCLACFASALVSMLARRPIWIFYFRNHWFRRDGGLTMPLGHTLKLRRHLVQQWRLAGEEMFSFRRPWWFSRYHPKAGDFIVDIGAGMCEDTFLFSKAVGSLGIVVAVEAHPDTFSVLLSLLTLNSISNVIPASFAAMDVGGYIKLSSLAEGDWQCNSTLLDSPSNSYVEVKACRLDEISSLASTSIIHFMKMNIEGAEVMALAGAAATLAKTQNICVCCHDFLGESTKTKSQVCRILNEAGFSLSFTPSNAPPWERDFVYGQR